MLFAIITPDGLDLVCETKADATRHVFDLRAMDVGKVEVKRFASWNEFDAWEAKHYA